MKLKIYDFKNPSKDSKPIGEIIINYKELIKTISLDKSYKTNGNSLDSDYRTKFELDFLDKYRDNYEYGKIAIKYIIRPGTSFTAFIKPNIFDRTYLKLLFEYYTIQRIKGIKKIIIGIIIGVTTAVILNLIL